MNNALSTEIYIIILFFALQYTIFSHFFLVQFLCIINEHRMRTMVTNSGGE